MNRLDALRNEFDAHEIDAFYVPKVDEYMGEYIRPCDERLGWISGFTGSAGFAVITRNRAALFVDGRYTLQAKAQAPEFEIIDWPANDLTDWLEDERLGFDPLLITTAQSEKWSEALGENFKPVPNLIDPLWQDRPQNAPYELTALPLDLAGKPSAEKIGEICEKLRAHRVDGFLSNNPESIAWLFNMRGGETPMVPAPRGYLLLHTDGRADLFGIEKPNFVIDANFHPLDALDESIAAFKGVLGYNHAALPLGRAAFIKEPHPITDPIIAAKARKNPTEVRASRNAHEADGRAMIKFLAWLDAQDPTTLDELKCADRLLEFRKENQGFITDSFDAISAWNGNAANPHYHATPSSFARFEENGVYLIDSGGHYPGATTDITRTVAIGEGIATAKAPFTQVLNGLANISTARFPQGTRGRDIDPFARKYLWQSAMNYGHGTGHGVGAQLSVHEGPASISSRGEVPLEDGMILSLEPGFYLANEFGIRLENLALVQGKESLSFETLSFVPLDMRLIDAALLTPQTQAWLNSYHEMTKELHMNSLDEDTQNWLKNATEPI